MRMWKEEWRWRQYGTVDTLKRSQLKARAGRSSLCSDDRLKRVVNTRSPAHVTICLLRHGIPIHWDQVTILTLAQQADFTVGCLGQRRSL